MPSSAVASREDDISKTGHLIEPKRRKALSASYTGPAYGALQELMTSLTEYKHLNKLRAVYVPEVQAQGEEGVLVLHSQDSFQ